MLRLLILMLALLAAPAAAGPALTADRLPEAEAEMQRLADGGNYVAAGALAQAVLDLRTRLSGPDSPELLKALFVLGNIAGHQDRPSDELMWAERAWMVAQRLPVLDIRRHSFAMSYALALSRAGRGDEALPIALHAAEYAALLAGAKSSLALQYKYNVAGIYMDLGRYERALPVFDEVLAGFAADPDPKLRRNEAVMTRSRARMLSKMWRDEAAADGFAEAYARYRKAFGADHPETARTAMEYAEALLRAQRWAVLEPLLKRETPRVEAAFGNDSYQYATMLYLTAFTMPQRDGRPTPGARRLMDRAVAIAEAAVGPGSKQMRQLYLDQSALAEEAGDFADALAAVRKAFALKSVDRESYYWLLWQARDAGVLTPEAAAAEAFQVAQVMGATQASRAISELNRRLVAEEGAYGGEWRQLTDLIRQEDTLQAQMAALVDRPRAQRDIAAEARLRDALTTASAEVAAAQAALGEKDPARAGLLGQGYMPADEIRAALGPDEALVYVDASGTYKNNFVFVVTPDGIDWVYMPASADELSAAVQKLRDGIALRLGTRSAEALDEGDGAPQAGFDLDTANWLYEQSFGRIAPQIAGKSHLYVVLTGAMGGLPPALLVTRPAAGGDTAAAHWLIRDHALTVLPSVASLRTTQLARLTGRAGKPFLAFADPSFAGGPAAAGMAALRGGLVPLPETAEEAREVAVALGVPGDDVKTGPAASEAGLKAADLKDYRILYFATHGLVAGDVVGAGALDQPALALTAGQGEDGFLTESEIAGLKLNADWVVLSACNTAVGRTPGAEALSGLAQAFFYAGARALLVSHWPVESRSAVALMTDLFRRRAADPALSAAEAQRLAILDLIDHPADPRWSHPAYWAPFILVGSPD